MNSDYDPGLYRRTLTRAQLDAHFATDYSPSKLIALLDSQFPSLYDQDGGVWEGYTIAQHTVMVLRQFEKYYAPYSLPGEAGRGWFRIFLALHDIGKPIAIAKDPQGKRNQHLYTWGLMEKFYRQIDAGDSGIALGKALLHDDPIGSYLRGRRSQKDTETLIRTQADSTPLSTADYFDLLQIYYKVDAGSYTANAGGKPSLDGLFDFDEVTPRLGFAPAVQRQMNRLTM